jgi:Skp family chaperone for outer membrane proteins
MGRLRLGKTDATARSADVKKSHGWAALAIVLSLSGLLAIAVAQNPGAPAGQPMYGTRIALLDTTNILQHHDRFKVRMEELKQIITAAEKTFSQKRNALIKDAEILQTYDKGTQQYMEKERELATRQGQLQAEFNLQRSDFMNREATIYYEVYQEILQATTYVCQQNSIQVVFRFNSEKASPQRPDSVLQMINQQVVWSSGVDITKMVLDDVNRRPAAPTNADLRGGAPARTEVPFNGAGGFQR